MVSVVYPLGNGSRRDDAELFFSLQSVQKYLRNAGQIFVVGQTPRFVEYPVPFVHIPADDPFEDGQQNVRHKLSLVCDDPRVSEKFLLMNDDFFLLREQDAENFPYFHQGELKTQIAERSSGPPGCYLDSLKLTEWYLSVGGFSTKDFEVHCPFTYERAKLKQLLGYLHSPTPGFLLRSLYGNIFDVPSERREDCKLRPYLDFTQIARWSAAQDFFSSSDRSFNPDMEQFLTWRLGEEI